MKRLVLCLDGTWNKQESATNIYHLSNLIAEGPVTDKQGNTIIQEIYYDTGVGTRSFGKFIDGAFGIGVSRIVIEAYDWLVERYQDGDEIYIFGFSRGAFTARSLAGMIAKCGLLMRGAPIPTKQIWEGYKVLGCLGDPRLDISEDPDTQDAARKKRRPEPCLPFNPIWRFHRQYWDRDRLTPKPRPEGISDEDEDPDCDKPQNKTERLLKLWSRRIKITCVGVFDTVGALGVNALAIPGLHSLVNSFHDTHLSSLTINAFHALAIDEHRANFVHIPYLLKAPAPKETLHGGRVEQRWFIGAHSNIGGGYEDNPLAQLPLRWMIAETSAIGLVYKDTIRKSLLRQQGEKEINDAIPSEIFDACLPLLQGEKQQNHLAATKPALRDSYAEFLPFGLWEYLIRSKREYRTLFIPMKAPNQGQSEEGQTKSSTKTPEVLLESVNEVLDPSVLILCRANKKIHTKSNHYNPINLWSYRHRSGEDVKEIRPSFLDTTSRGYWLTLPLWAILIACAIGCIAGCLPPIMGHPFRWSWAMNWALYGLLGALACELVESYLNYHVSAYPPPEAEAPDVPKQKSLRIAVLLFAIICRVMLLLSVPVALCLLGILKLLGRLN